MENEPDPLELRAIESGAVDEAATLAATPATASSVAQTPAYQCKECNGKSFKSKQGLKGHVLKYHPKAPASTTSPAAPVERTKAANPQATRTNFLDRSFFSR